MGKLLLCQGAVAKTPYYFRDADVNVFSYEEMCYLIVHYPEEVCDNVMDEGLFKWISSELGISELADTLSDLRRSRQPLTKFVIAILSYSGYASNDSVSSALTIFRTLEKITPKERDKIRADKLLSDNRCFEAIRIYRNIISQCEPGERELLGKLWHNMGTAYGRMFIFETAAVCFERAYHLTSGEASRKAAQMCSFIIYGDRAYDTDIFGIDPGAWQELSDYSREHAQSDAVTSKMAAITKELRGVTTENESEFFKIYAGILDGFKNDYLKRAEYGAS